VTRYQDDTEKQNDRKPFAVPPEDGHNNRDIKEMRKYGMLAEHDMKAIGYIGSAEEQGCHYQKFNMRFHFFTASRVKGLIQRSETFGFWHIDTGRISQHYVLNIKEKFFQSPSSALYN
jgi:hypothetical protein